MRARFIHHRLRVSCSNLVLSTVSPIWSKAVPYTTTSRPTAKHTALLKELREVTEASISDCLSAIKEAGPDREACIAHLQRCGAVKAIKKNSRDARQGLLIAGTIPDRCGYLVEVNTETDFAARSARFLEYCIAVRRCIQDVAAQCELIGNRENIETFLRVAIEETTRDVHATTSAAISERIDIRKVRVLSWPAHAMRTTATEQGTEEYHFGAYAHSLSHVPCEDLPIKGSVAAIASIALPSDQRPIVCDHVERVTRALAQHIVATAGMYAEELASTDATDATRTVVPLAEQKYLGDGDAISDWLTKQLGPKAKVVEGTLLRLGH